MDARNKQQMRVPLAPPEIKVEVVDLESSEESDEAPRGGKGKGTAPAVVKAGSKTKEAVPVVKKHSAAASAQKTKALEKKKRAEMAAAQVKERARAAAISAAVEEEDEEEEEEDDSSDEDYVEEVESVDEDTGEDSGYEEEEELIPRVAIRENLPVQEQQSPPVEQPVVVDVEAYGEDDDELAIVKVKKFQGCRMLADVVRTEDNGVASRTRRRKVLKRQRLYSHFTYDRDSKGTFSDPINL
ncbi:unnamed protein product [Urochloa humidicola]